MNSVIKLISITEGDDRSDDDEIQVSDIEENMSESSDDISSSDSDEDDEPNNDNATGEYFDFYIVEYEWWYKLCWTYPIYRILEMLHFLQG